MERAASVALRPDVTVKDAHKLIHWLENKEVIQYLNEDSGVAEAIQTMLQEVNVPFLTYHFNRFGRFFMIVADNENSIGFIKLVEQKESDTYEIVVTIGDNNIWGQGYGSCTIRECLKMVFFEWRAKKIIAKIHHKNDRSVHLFRKFGFRWETDHTNLAQYVLTLHDYLHKTV